LTTIASFAASVNDTVYFVIGGSVCDDNCEVLSVSENGYGKKTDIKEFKCQARAGKGVTGYNITDKTGPLAGMVIVKESDDLMSITSDGVIIRMSTDEISTFGRVTQGVRVMKIADGVKVVSIASTKKEEDEQQQEETQNQEIKETIEEKTEE